MCREHYVKQIVWRSPVWRYWHSFDGHDRLNKEFAEHQTIGSIKLTQVELPDKNYSSQMIPVNHAIDSRQKESPENDKTYRFYEG